MKKQIEPHKLMNWVLLFFLSISFLGSYKNLKLNSSAINNKSDLSILQKAKNQVVFTSSCDKIGLQEIANESQEDDEEESGHFGPRTKSQQAFGYFSKTCTSFFPSINRVKLFILFHSWKSFLQS